MKNKLIIKGAKENNLKNIDIELPRNKFIVMTGVSGSGKTSLAFDTIYAEGQRRYVESLSAYARQFLGQMEKPEVEYIEGLSPAISIDQKQRSRNPRSTVGTVTEIYDYLRLLFARIGDVYCPNCGNEISKESISQMVDRILEIEKETKFLLLAPVVRGRKGEYIKLLEGLKKEGFVRVRVDGVMMDLSDDITMDKNKKHDIEVVVDRLVMRDNIRRRVSDSLEIALKLGDGIASVGFLDDRKEIVFSEKYMCLKCHTSITEVEPRLFSFNSPYGSCPSCHGLGFNQSYSLSMIIPDKKKSISEGAIDLSPWNSMKAGYYQALLRALAKHYKFSLDKPFCELSKKIQGYILNGSPDKIKIEYIGDSGSEWNHSKKFEGVIPNLKRRYSETNSDSIKKDIEKYMIHAICEDCKGTRLRKEARSILINGKNIAEIVNLTIDDALIYFLNITIDERKRVISKEILKEIIGRLKFLNNVGLNYLSLSRSANTLSGGESQRIRLATQIGSGLVGVLYILDEPSIGLHQRDNGKLIESLLHLKEIGNTLIVVEHDEETIMASDVLVDIGPLAGKYGGEVVAIGTPEEVIKNEKSITGQYLSGKRKIEIPIERRIPKKEKLRIVNANLNNLKNVTVDIPLGVLACVTGVSGSGKSTLVNEILYKGCQNTILRKNEVFDTFEKIEGLENIDKLINIDQAPIGRTPRSNPATYTGVFDLIRTLFAGTKEAKVRGYMPGRFSFNIKGGRCENCKGDGIIKIEMHFLPDVYVPCEVCDSKRYNRETLDILFKGKNIADILKMTVEEAHTFFSNIPKIERKLKTLLDVGLGYIEMGQSATTLSGGESQRVKLASELSKRSTGKTLYILDEPTTGLHFYDIDKLMKVLLQLVDQGNSVLVIEHNLDVIKMADYIIDIGPEGGKNGGKIIATGTPEEIVKIKKSYTGEYLKKVLERKR